MDKAILSSLIYILFSIGVGAFLRPRFDDDRVSLRIIIYWVLSACIVFLVPWLPLTFLLLGVLMVATTPSRLEDRGPFFICVLMAIPYGVSWTIPFPGLNFLITVNHGILASLVILIPMFFAKHTQSEPPSKDAARPRATMMDGVMVVLCLLVVVLYFRGENLSVTHAMRQGTVSLLMMLVPYFALSRSFVRVSSFRNLMYGAITVGAMMVPLAMISIATNYNPYLMVAPNELMDTHYRGGVTRVTLTSVHTLAGLMLTITLALLLTARRHADRMKWAAYPLMGGALLGLVATQSRGAYLAAGVAAIAYVLVKVRNWVARITMVVAGVVALGGVFLALSESRFEQVDEHGTFQYRSELLKAAVKQIADKPLFGDPGFIESPHFAHLVQGQGIVDIVNAYLNHALLWGGVGLSLYLILFAQAGIRGLRATDRLHRMGDTRWQERAFGIGLVAIFAGELVAIFTTSEVSYYIYVNIIFLAIARSFSVLVRKMEAEGALSAADASEEIASVSQSGTAPQTQPVAPVPSPTPDGDLGDPAPPADDWLDPGEHADLADDDTEAEFEIDIRPGVKGWPT